ncbi:SMP-30/gluconolactonase/LRE family protein [Dermatobacter hominis]|uniref:SMP-30/gluconolactonase/LRE family protein n=1 Tax=Dermatobacter hominis TaxID=2884263 RepID=UPI001D12FE62|nr:SMP-30/gluconolactonase/LRE family protein [Dermatobacter hominis]UDY36824.1 SMP-30/gluconolactonase/LRE family protein [Dermatobacter hominis]
MTDATTIATEWTTVASGLRFPEGPVAMDDGSVLLVEIARGTLSRVGADGAVEVVAECGGGPNGAAIGPDGDVWITNNGGCFEFVDLGGVLVPGGVPDSWSGGSIQRVDPSTGEVTTVYTECDGRPLRAPNDLVFDAHGGFWFTDHGVRLERSSDRTGVFYATADGSTIREVIFPMDAPNGVGLSPAGDKVYVAETHTGRVWSWDVPEPGVASGSGLLAPHGDLLVGLPGMQLLDSLAVDGDGWVCVGTLVNGGITAVSPDGTQVEHHPADDLLVTNICFGGPDLRTAYATASATGRLLSAEWPRPGLRLANT